MNRSRPRPFFSLWAWLVLAPYLLLALGGMDGASTPREWALGATVSVLVAIALGALYFTLGRIEIAIANRPPLRWTLVGVALAGMAFGRPALLTALQHAVGIDLVPTPFAIRVALNGIVITLSTVLIHLLLNAVRRNLDGRRRLLAVLWQLRSQTELIEATAGRIADDFQREVRTPVLDALGALVSRDLPPAQLSEELRFVAHAVVRPLSHQAAGAGLEEALDGIAIEAVPAPEAPPERGLLQPSRIVAAPAWLTTLVCMMLVLTSVIFAQGAALGLVLMAAGSAVSYAGSLGIHFLPLPRRPAAAVAVLTLAHFVVGAAVIWVLHGSLALTPIIWTYLVYGTLGYTTAAVVLVLTSSSLRELAGHQEATAAAVAEAEQRAFRARQRLASEARLAGRLLHTEVQGDLVATSLQLRLGTAGEEPLLRLIDRVDQLLGEPLGTDEDAPTSASAIRDSFRASLNAWSLSLDLAIDVEPAALDHLAEHPRAASIAHDALSEALTNAVRHGRGDSASVAIRLTGDGIEVVISNPGRIAAVSASRIGLQDLDARARRVTLAQEGSNVVLSVLI